MRDNRPPGFDEIARNLAQTIDTILLEERSRERRIALIQRQIRHALGLGYRAAKRVEAAD